MYFFTFLGMIITVLGIYLIFPSIAVISYSNGLKTAVIGSAIIAISNFSVRGKLSKWN